MPPKSSKSKTTGTGVSAAHDFSTIQTPEGRTLYVETEVLKAIAELFKIGRPIALLGEPGTGKTDLARAIMALALSGGRISKIFSQEYGGIVSGDLLDGERTLDLDGRITIIPSQWLQAVREASKGHAVGLINDEHNRGTPQGLNKQMRSLSHHEYVSDLDGILTWNPQHLLMISTLNVGFSFSGTSKVDQALGDRFYPFVLQAPPQEIVEKILDDRYPSMDAKDKKGVLNAYSASRRSEDSYKLTVRDVIKITDGVVYGGMNLKNSVSRLIGGMVMLNGMSEEAVESLVTAISAYAA
jgi:midasin (ATPase involved in ribosome maturation)